MRPSSLVIALTFASLLTGCPNRPQASLPAPAPATITSFTASPSSLQKGGTVQLEWGTTNATDVTIEHVGKGPLDLGTQKTAGRLSITVDSSAIFLMTAQGAGGSDVRTTSVALGRRPESVLFSAVPSTIEAGGTATLVWNAAGASRVTLEEIGGPSLNVGAQSESGSIQVSPTKTTSYRLQADDTTATAEIKVAPTIVSFSAGNVVPSAGERVTLTWTTASATAVTLRRVGLATPITIAPGMVAAGSATDTVPATLPPDAIMQYVLEATDGTATTSKALEVAVGGGVRINTFTAPEYAPIGGTFVVRWTTVGATSAELVVDGQRRYLAQSPGEVANGNYTLSSPTQSTRVVLVVRNSRGAEAREERTIEGVGPLAFNFFRADKASINVAGEPVRLEWSVTNARIVRITSNTGAGFYRQFTGNVDTGSLIVLPNSRPPALTRITYRLEAEDGTGAAPIARTVDVDVTTPATFTFSRQLPVRAPTTVTGTTAAGTTLVAGFKNVEKAPSGETFIDIRRSGTVVPFSATGTAVNFLLPAPFETTLFGTRRAGTRLNVSRFGWFVLTTSSSTATGRPDNDRQIGSTLEPLTVAPYWNNLVTANGQVHFRVDGVSDARRLIVQWSGVRPTNGPIDARLTFQAQLYSNGKVVFAYRDFFKVQVTGTGGVVNFSETDEVNPSMMIADGDVWRFFAPLPPPAPLRIEATPFAGAAIVNGERMEAEGLANYPLNQFYVSEVHYKPSVANGGWIEIANNADSGVDIGGWDVDYGGVATYQIPMGTVLPPNGRVALAAAADYGDGEPDGGLALADGGFVSRPAPTALFPSTFLPPSTGVFVRIGIAGNEYTRFPSATTTLPAMLAPGRAFGLEDERLPYVTYQTTTTRFQCAAVGPVYGVSGQRGSPGLPNPSCWMYEAPLPSSNAFQSLAGTGTSVTFVPTGTFDAIDEGLALITLPRAIRPYGAETTQITISSNGFVVPYAFTGCGTLACASNKSTPSTSLPTFVLAPFWDDLDGNLTNSAAFWQQDSNGDVTVSWEHFNIFTSTVGLAVDVNFQVILRENGDVEYRFGPMSGVGGTGSTSGALRAAGSSATTWIDIGPAASRINVNSGAAPGIQPNTAFFYQSSLNR